MPEKWIAAIDPQGQPVEVHPDDYVSALRDGYRPDPGIKVPTPPGLAGKPEPTSAMDLVQGAYRMTPPGQTQAALTPGTPENRFASRFAQKAVELGKYSLIPPPIQALLHGPPKPEDSPLESRTPVRSTLAMAAGVDEPAVRKASQEHQYPELAAETAFPIAAMLLGGRLFKKPGVATATAEQSNALAAAIPSKPSRMNVPRLTQAVTTDLREAAMQEGLSESNFRGVQAPANLNKAAARAISNMNAEFDSYLSKANPKSVVSGKPIADAIRGQITDVMRKTDPDMVNGLMEQAKTFDQNFTLGELNDLRIAKNKELASPYYGKDVSGKVNVKASVMADKVALDAMRGLLYDEMAARVPGATAEQIRALKMRESSMMKLRPLLQRMENSVANAHSEYSAAGPYERLRGSIKPAVAFSPEVSVIRLLLAEDPTTIAGRRLGGGMYRQGAFSGIGGTNRPVVGGLVESVVGQMASEKKKR